MTTLTNCKNQADNENHNDVMMVVVLLLLVVVVVVQTHPFLFLLPFSLPITTTLVSSTSHALACGHYWNPETLNRWAHTRQLSLSLVGSVELQYALRDRLARMPP